MMMRCEVDADGAINTRLKIKVKIEICKVIHNIAVVWAFAVGSLTKKEHSFEG